MYTGLHGTGALAVPPALEAFGFRNVHEVASQAIPDGDFPTVASPNPEEGPALAEAVALAEKVGASLVMGTDPDSDRVGLAVPDGKGSFVLLNGNETAALLTDHVLSKWKESGKLDRPSFVAKTVVTTNLLADLADHYGVQGARNADRLQTHCGGHSSGRRKGAVCGWWRGKLWVSRGRPSPGQGCGAKLLLACGIGA